MTRDPLVEIRTSPHIKHTPSVEQIMRNVVYALLPVCAFAVWAFGISALALILVTTLACVLTEQIYCWAAGRPTTVDDWSVVITGLLLALTLPPGFPLWMAAVAGFVGVSLGKALFWGLGHNVMNPALVGRAFVQAAFPVSITTWTPGFTEGRFTEFVPSTLTLPFMQPPDISAWIQALNVDGFTGATPLALMKFEQVATPAVDLFTGMTAGSAGETSVLIILIGGVYLALRNMMNWRLPTAVLVTAAATGGLFWWLDPAAGVRRTAQRGQPVTATEHTTPVPTPPSSVAMIRTLGGIAMLSGLLVVLVHQLTLPAILENQRRAIERAVFLVVPGAVSRADYQLTADGLSRVTQDGPEAADAVTVYAGFDAEGSLKGVALEAAAPGYQDVIKLLYGYDPACQCITGIYVLKMTETPGLGDKIITDGAFLENFRALDARLNAGGDALANPIVTVKHGTKTEPWQIDAISGATVSSKAVGKALNESAQRILPRLVSNADQLKGAR